MYQSSGNGNSQVIYEGTDYTCKDSSYVYQSTGNGGQVISDGNGNTVVQSGTILLWTALTSSGEGGLFASCSLAARQQCSSQKKLHPATRPEPELKPQLDAQLPCI